MTTFSTIINFGMLGLLRRLHRLQIQATLQAESNKTGIIYPQLEKHKAKEGKNVYLAQSLYKITDVSIAEAILKAEITAKGSIEELGMADLLREHKKWDSLGDVKEMVVNDDSDDSEDDDDDDCTATDELVVTTLVPEVCVDDSKDIAADIKTLSQTDGSLICSKLKEKLSQLQQSLPRLAKSSSTSISTYSEAAPREISRQKDISEQGNIKNKVKSTLFSSSPFLKVCF